MSRAALLLLVALLLAGCTSDDAPSGPDLPPESAFAEGTCRDAAPDLLALGRTIPRLGDDGTVEQELQQTLVDVQDRVFARLPTAEPELGSALDELVERIGGVRIRAVGNTYEPALGTALQESYDRVLSLCTTSQ